MAQHAEVFISGTTRDLGSSRREIKDALLALQIFPIEESNFALAYGPLVAMLRDLIGRCDAVIHLAGFYYGAEPPQRPPGERRRSYTQIEYDVARELKKPLYLFLATENYEPDELSKQSDEEQELQLTHWRAIEQCGDIYYRFSGREELGRRIKELRFPTRSSQASRRVVNLPYNSLGPLFKGRDTALTELRQRLTAGGGRAGLTARQAIHGLGGVGKTRLAIEYAWRHASDYTALLFISARSPADLRTNLAGLCSPLVLGLPEQTQPEETARMSAVFRWLGENSGWLLILDNADTQEAASAIEEALPRLQGGQLIITSRIADWSAAIQSIELDVLTEKDATAFLLERTGPRRMNTPADADNAAALTRDLGRLALALELAGAYIAKNRLSFSEYRQRWEARKVEVLEWRDERLTGYPTSLAMTWMATFNQLSDVERELLNMLAWFGDEPVPLSILNGVPISDPKFHNDLATLASWGFRWTEGNAGPEGGSDARDALAGLASWNLARLTADGEFTVHVLVQKITRFRLSEMQNESSLGLALDLLSTRLPSPEWDHKGWRLWEQLAPHCRTLINRVQDCALEPKATRMMNDLALWLYNSGKYSEAEPLYRRALAIDEKVNLDHPDVARDLGHLAMLLSATNRLGEAKSLFSRALAIWEKALGPEHPHVATGLNNLAELLRATNQLADAEPLYKRALAIREKALDPEHPDVAISLNNLALLLNATNRLDEAEPLMRRALEIDEKAKPEHPNVARDLTNLAGLLQATNRIKDAEPLYRRALAIWEKALGPEHPHVATGLNNLAELFRATKRLVEAEPLYKRALKIAEKSLGSEHPTLASLLDNLAGLLHETNRLCEAEHLYRRALAIRENALGPEHPDMAHGLNNLAEICGIQGRYDEAEPLYKRALSIDERSGLDHPHLATSLTNIAGLLYDTNRPMEAEPLYRRAMQITEKSLGSEDPQLVSVLNGLAKLLYDTGRPKEAELLFRRALSIDERSGLDHPSLANSLNDFACLLQSTNRLAEAEPIMRRALAIYEKSVGPNHTEVGSVLSNLAGLLRDTNRVTEAEPLMRRALAICERSAGANHLRVGIALSNLAGLLCATNRCEEAEPLYRRALDIAERSLGSKHPTVARILDGLVPLLRATNRLDEAEKLMRKQLRIYADFSYQIGHADPNFRQAVNNYIGLLMTMGLSEAEILVRFRSAIKCEPNESV